MIFLKELKNIYYKFLKLKSRLLYGRPVLVLMYHRISDVVGDKLTHLTVSIENFENQLRYFKEKFHILKLDEEWNSLLKTGVVITFDDGYADNIINALPLLEKYQIPATIFVTTLNTNTKNEFWWDRLIFDYAACKESFYLPNTNDKVSKSDATYKNCTNFVCNLTNDEKDNWFFEFEKLNQIVFYPRDDFRSLTNLELKLLSEHPLISIGIHTHNHYPLGSLSYQEQMEELELSINMLKELTTDSINYLALPHGSYNSDTLAIADILNLKSVLLANDYYSNQKNKTSKKINRVLVPNCKDNGNWLKKFVC